MSPKFPLLSVVLYWDFYNCLCLLHPYHSFSPTLPSTYLTLGIGSSPLPSKIAEVRETEHGDTIVPESELLRLESSEAR